MKKLDAFNVAPVDLFKQCVSGVNDRLTQAALNQILNVISSSNISYIDKAKNSSLSDIEQQTIFNGYHLKNDLILLYEEQMAKENGSARDVYNQIKACANSCGMCFHQKPTTLDHYLPKTKYPIYAVNPFNLIPCCRDCNTYKSTYSPTEADEALLHPYFDKEIFFVEKWLAAEIKTTQDNKIFIIYTASPPDNWNEVDKKRVKKHMKKYHLNELYTAQASNEFVASDYRFLCLFRDGGAELLKYHLGLEAASRNKKFPNSWQAALYTALSQDEWFCEKYYA